MPDQQKSDCPFGKSYVRNPGNRIRNTDDIIANFLGHQHEPALYRNIRCEDQSEDTKDRGKYQRSGSGERPGCKDWNGHMQPGLYTDILPT